LQLLLASEFITKMNSGQFVQQFEPMELEYRESNRLEAKVARAFHKNVVLKKLTGSASGAFALAATSALTSVGEVLSVEILLFQHFGSDSSFIAKMLLSSVPSYWNIIFCYLNVKGAELYF